MCHVTTEVFVLNERPGPFPFAQRLPPMKLEPDEAVQAAWAFASKRAMEALSSRKACADATRHEGGLRAVIRTCFVKPPCKQEGRCRIL